MPAGPSPIDYVQRWRDIVVARRGQHDAVCAAQGRDTSDYWARRAGRYQRFVKEGAAHGDAFVEIVRRHLEPGDTVLDVGAGPGRHALPLGRSAARVIALDPSAAMLGFLRDEVAARGLSNVDVIEASWPEGAERVPRADVVLSAHVLYPIEDVVPFLRALDAKTKRLCFLNLMAEQPWFDRLGLWEAVHGEARLAQPTYIDAVNVLHQLGCFANVEVAQWDLPRTFESLEDAVDGFADAVAAADDPGRLERLREALDSRLERAEGGRRVSPEARQHIAAVWWQAGALDER